MLLQYGLIFINLRNCFIWFCVTAVGGKPKPEFYSFPGRLRWTLLPTERCGDSPRPWFEPRLWSRNSNFRLRLQTSKFFGSGCGSSHSKSLGLRLHSPGSNTQPFSWKANTLPLSHRRPFTKLPLHVAIFHPSSTTAMQYVFINRAKIWPYVAHLVRSQGRFAQQLNTSPTFWNIRYLLTAYQNKINIFRRTKRYCETYYWFVFARLLHKILI